MEQVNNVQNIKYSIKWFNLRVAGELLNKQHTADSLEP